MTTPGTMPEPGSVAALQGGHYVVASRTTPGALWLVTAGPRGLGCSCPAGRQPAPPRGGCWHTRQVAAWCRQQDAAKARPTFPVNVSAIFD